MPTPAAGLVTTSTAYSDCNSSNKANTALTTYTGYDAYGNAVAGVDPYGVAHSSLYSGSGCTLYDTPAVLSSAWTAGSFTRCDFYYNNRYSYYAALSYEQKNALEQTAYTDYDPTQGYAPLDVWDVNSNITNFSYIYATDGSVTANTSEPEESGDYTTRTHTRSTCTATSTLPCVVEETNASLYPNAVTRTYYDSQGRAVETRTPLDASNDLITFTVYDDQHNQVFVSQPFRFPRGDTWVDPASALIDNGANGGGAPGGTITVYDPQGRVIATRDAIEGSSSEPGISCDSLSGLWTSCTSFAMAGQATGNTSQTFHVTETIDANNVMTATFEDALGRERYRQTYASGRDIGAHILSQDETQYNALDLPTLVKATDLAPQGGQSVTLISTTATYDDLGRLTVLNDPDRGTHTYTHDEDGRVIKDISGTRSIGTSYDLLGRTTIICQLLVNTDCSDTQNLPLRVFTYDGTFFQSSGIWRLFSAKSYTYFPATNGQGSTDVTTTQYFRYDERGRVNEHDWRLGSSWADSPSFLKYLTAQSYNDADQPTTITTGINSTPSSTGGYTFTNVYDATAGTLVGLSGDSGSTADVSTRSFDAHGQVGTLTLLDSAGTLATRTITYDGDLRPIQTTTRTPDGSSTFFSSSQGYDPLGNVNSVSTTQAAISGVSGSEGTETQNFCYDARDHLTWASNIATPPTGQDCGQQTAGNTLSGASYNTGYTYTNLDQMWQGPLNGNGSQEQYLYCESAHPRALSGVYPTGITCATRGDSFSYQASYDAWGNLTKREVAGETEDLRYDALDQLVEADQEGSANTVQYVYDAFGQRIAQRDTTAGGSTITTYPLGVDEYHYPMRARRFIPRRNTAG